MCSVKARNILRAAANLKPRTLTRLYTTRQWQETGTLKYAVSDSRIEIAVPRQLIRLKGGDTLTFDFKWADNPADLQSVISLCTDGDTAPNRRFNYRFVWKKNP